MDLKQNVLERLLDLAQLGKMTPDQANVALVRAKRVQLVTSRMPSGVRRAMNSAVARGELAHMKKDGLKPEAYYHPSFSDMAHEERCARERGIYRAVAGVTG